MQPPQLFAGLSLRQACLRYSLDDAIDTKRLTSARNLGEPCNMIRLTRVSDSPAGLWGMVAMRSETTIRRWVGLVLVGRLECASY